ncbi:hypothetical protein MAR_018517 [Mya arenaria]|uniref:Uncharacterized protein n=1 Tax=Mya arenaria TaxID=6604 RepID=A0ABY7EHM4_MYAAR|nr:hypothetical protein MAR_018517 [Mya arenaria]
MAELRNEDQTSFKHFMRMSHEMFDEVKVEPMINKQQAWYRISAHPLYLVLLYLDNLVSPPVHLQIPEDRISLMELKHEPFILH